MFPVRIKQLGYRIIVWCLDFGCNTGVIHLTWNYAVILNKKIGIYSSPSLIRPPYLSRNCGHIREVAFGEREK